METCRPGNRGTMNRGASNASTTDCTDYTDEKQAREGVFIRAIRAIRGENSRLAPLHGQYTRLG